MKRIIATVFLTALASAAFAERYVLVEDGQTPPSGYTTHVPSYEWKDGRFVRNGTVYKSLSDGN